MRTQRRTLREEDKLDFSSCEQKDLSGGSVPLANKPCAGRILLAEDDVMLSRFLVRLLRAEGYEVELVADGPSVLARLSADVHVLLLDLNLPQMDGLTALQQLRPRFPKLSVLVLTARSRSDGLLPALEGGADDCLLKPFSYLELLARIRVLLRRSLPLAGDVSHYEDLVLNREHALVRRGERRIELTQREFALLEYLMRTPGVPVPRAVLLKGVWGDSCGSATNVVDVYMKYVRDKVDLPGLPKLVRTIRGTGYMLSAA